MLGDVEVKDPPAVMGEHDEDEQDAQAHGGTVKKSRETQIRDVIGKEHAPGLRGRCAALRDEPGDGALGQVEAELQQLTMDSRSAPERIGRGHSCDKAAISGLTGGRPRVG
jgi:hypothetical protein